MQHVFPCSCYFTFKIPQYMPCYSKIILFALFSLNLKYSKCEAPYHFLTKACIQHSSFLSGKPCRFFTTSFYFLLPSLMLFVLSLPFTPRLPQRAEGKKERVGVELFHCFSHFKFQKKQLTDQVSKNLGYIKHSLHYFHLPSAYRQS